VKYKTDLEQYDTPEFWKEAGAFGDCEDYALLKRALLEEQGFDRVRYSHRYLLDQCCGD
jgi:predicted transglutaminase-like cysteine proteinase